MNKIEIYEPALCCPTGVCGPSVDPDLLRITSVVKASRNSENTRVLRRNLGQNPKAFAKNELVKEKLAKEGMDVLPLTLLNGEVLCQGRYPTNEEIEQISDLKLAELQA